MNIEIKKCPDCIGYAEFCRCYWVKEVKKLEGELKVCREALKAVDTYFKACANAWEANEGRVVSEKGAVIEGTEDIESLCNIAGNLVRGALSK